MNKMNELLLNLSKSFPFPLIILDYNGNIEFINNSTALFFKHFDIPSISITNFRDFKSYFPQLHSFVESYYTDIFSGNQSKYGIKFSEDYIADVTLMPNFENRELKNLTIIIEDRTSHYKKVNAYEVNSLFLKEVIEIKDLSAGNSKKLFQKTLNLLNQITNQEKILIAFGSNDLSNNFFYKGFTKNEAESIVNNQNIINLIFNEEHLKPYNILKNIYFIPNLLMANEGIKIENKDNSTLMCAIIKNRKTPFGIIFIEFKSNIIPYVSMLKQISLFLEFAPLIFGNYEKTKELIYQSNFIQSIINELPQNIIVCDSDFQVELINGQVSENIKDFDKKEIHLKEIIGKKLFESLLKMEFNHNKSIEIVEGDKYYNLSFSKIKFGKKTKLIVVITDITERKILEEKLIEKEKLDVVKSFCVTANDRINTPLTVMSTKLDILEEYAKNESLQKDIVFKITSTLKKQIDKIANTISELNSLKEVKLIKYANLDNTKQIKT